MEGLGMEASSPSIFEIMLGWFTPTVLFLILNLVIGTIVLTSKVMHRHHGGGAATVPAASDDRPKLSRTSSAFVLERLRSLGLYRQRSDDIPLETSDPPPPPLSEAEIEETVQEEESMRKSSGEKEAVVRRPAAAKAVRRMEMEEEEKEVDARADDFINRFRHQLRLQRLESLTRYKDAS